MSPLDLHVLGTPPAFVLSQDQTLSFNPFYPHPKLSLGSLALRINCRSFLRLSLYRFQGSAPLARSLYILSNPPRFVKPFFKVFLRFWDNSALVERFMSSFDNRT